MTKALSGDSDSRWLLDLFCGVGGAAMGYYKSGFEVVGIDVVKQPRFPFTFIQGDAVVRLLDKEWCRQFDAIHASPPCQRYSILLAAGEREDHANLVDLTRDLLTEVGKPYVIENVPGAPLRDAVMLCGSMFGLGCVDDQGQQRELRRHRLFECSFPVVQPACVHKYPAIGVYGHGPHHNRTDKKSRGGYQGSLRERREAMGMHWANTRETSQAVPPAYTRHIAKNLIYHLTTECATV